MGSAPFVLRPAQESPEVTKSTGSADKNKQHKDLAKTPHPISPYQARASGPVLAIRKPAASDPGWPRGRIPKRKPSVQAQRCRRRGQNRKGKSGLEKAAQLGRKKLGSNKVREKV